MGLRGNTAIGLAVLALAGCARPDFAPPEAGLGLADRRAGGELAPAPLDLTAYWRMLDDQLLTEFVEAAMANNLDIAQSAARLDQARAQLRGARAGYFPQLSASGQASRDIGDGAADDVFFTA